MAGEVNNPAIQSFNAQQRSSAVITFGGSTNGTSTATSATTLTDSGAAWVTNAYAGMTCYSNGKSGVIASNTATAVTVASWTGGTPTAVNTYMIGAPATTFGYVGTQTVFTTTGAQYVRAMIPIILAGLVSAGAATLALGTGGSTVGFVAATAIANLDGTNPFWFTATPTANLTALPAALKDIVIKGGVGNITVTVATADITSGQIGFTVIWDNAYAPAASTVV